MQHKIIEKLKSEEGSSLAFVIIIGLVIMLLVISLLAVANSDFTFTQESLESRQAYIDAKSVIEFGKVEINRRMTNLNDKNIELQALYDKYKPLKENGDDVNALETQINLVKEARDKLAAELYDPYVIYGNTENVTETLTVEQPAADNTKIVKLGELKVENPIGNQYKFSIIIDADNLRRKLDYEVEFGYVPSTATSSGSTTPDIQNWLSTQIKKMYDNNGSKNVLQCMIAGSSFGEYNSLALNTTVESNLKIDQFDWMKEKTLNLNAKNICFTVPLPSDNNEIKGASFIIKAEEELRFKTDYYQNNWDSAKQDTQNTLEATNIVFEKNLEVEDGSNLTIRCENLSVAGNITLGKGSTLTIIGTKTNSQMIVGGVLKSSENYEDEKNYNNYNSSDLDISNLSYFSCKGLDLYRTSLQLNSKTIIIDGNVILNDLEKSSVSTQYYDCTGKTSIKRNLGTNKKWITGENEIEFKSFNNNELNIRFRGGYEQQDAYVDITGADTVVFGGTFRFHNKSLNVQADDIYFDGSYIYVEDKSEYFRSGDSNQFTYSGKGGVGTTTKINVRSVIRPTYRVWYNNTIQYVWEYYNNYIFAYPGMYAGVKGTMPDGLYYPQDSYKYSPENDWPKAPTSPNGGTGGQGSTVITVTPGNVEITGSETYY